MQFYLKNVKIIKPIKDKIHFTPWRICQTFSKLIVSSFRKLKNLLSFKSISKYFAFNISSHNFNKIQVIKIVFTSICVRNWKQTFSKENFTLYWRAFHISKENTTYREFAFFNFGTFVKALSEKISCYIKVHETNSS